MNEIVFQKPKSASAWAKTMSVFMLGLAAGLPYAALIGTLNAWMTEAEIPLAQIGIMSWIGLSYAFKFLWAPVLNMVYPKMLNMGKWRHWIIIFQLVIVVALFMVASVDPGKNLGLIAGAALLATFASASQDIAIDAWRIKIADSDKELDAMATMYQIGYRVAAFLAGFGALIFAANMGWQATYYALGGIMLISFASVFLMPDADDSDPKQNVIRIGRQLTSQTRLIYLAPVLFGWIICLLILIGFMFNTLTAEVPPSTRNFTLGMGPIIVAICVLGPVISGLFLMSRQDVQPIEFDKPVHAKKFSDILYASVLEPMMELVYRLRWSAILVLALVLTYRYADTVWGSFAYTFYLGKNFGALGHTLEEVATASKLIGVIMTLIGTMTAGAVMLWIGRMNTLVIAGILAAVTNLIFADLAAGGAGVDGFISFMNIDAMYGAMNNFADIFIEPGVENPDLIDARLGRLIVAIAAENIVVGIASVVYVAYLSGIVNKQYAAVQYALLASLTMLIGTLGRGYIGELIEVKGFEWVFILTAILGGVGVFFSILEWIRQRFYLKAS